MRMKVLLGFVGLLGCAELEELPPLDVQEDAPMVDRSAPEAPPSDQAAPPSDQVDSADAYEAGPDVVVPDTAVDAVLPGDVVADVPSPADHVVQIPDREALEVAVEPEADAAPDTTGPPDQIPVDAAPADVPPAADVQDAVADRPEMGMDPPDVLAPDVLLRDAPSEVELVDIAPPEDLAPPMDRADPVDAPPIVDVPPVDRPDVRTCGARGLACCPGRVCDATLGCSASGLCVPCGGRGQPCCLTGASLCLSDLSCRSSSFTCECGNANELCCPGYLCNTVSGLALTCRVVGSRRLCG